jgi:hypothetical protein
MRIAHTPQWRITLCACFFRAARKKQAQMIGQYLAAAG